MRPLRALCSLLVLALAACGDDGHTHTLPDAPPTGDGSVDAALDAPPLPPGCDYAEARDTTNDDIFASGTPEPTGLTLAPQAVVCGQVDIAHYDATEQVVDVDGFTVTLAADADVLLTISGAGADAISLFTLEVYGGSGFTEFQASADFYGDHGVTSVRLPAGTYEFVMAALHTAALSAPVPYEIRIATDAPDTRCPEVTTGGHVEGGDGATSDGNDVVRIDYSAATVQSLTVLPTDVPEATGIVVTPANNDRLAGSLADIATPDSYEDKDTYQFTTSATTNQLAIRLTWPSTTADLDYFLFEAGTLPSIGGARRTALAGPELQTFSVKPNTSYWLLIGAYAGTSTGLPATYSATLCGAAFTP